MQFRINPRTVLKIYRKFGEWMSKQPDLCSTALGAEGIRPAEKSFMDNLLKTPGTSVDIGCGPGRMFGYLAERGQQITGLDISTALLGTAKQNAPRSGNAPNLIRADIADVKTLPSNIPRFDNLISLGCVPGGLFTEAEHFGFAEVCKRLAAPGSRLFIDTITHSRSKALLEFPLFNTTVPGQARGTGIVWWHRVGALCAHYYPSKDEIFNIARLAGFNVLIDSCRYANYELFAFENS